MYRRTFLLCIVLGLLALSSLLVAPLNVLALTATLTATRTSTAVGCNPPPPTYTVQVSPSAISVNTGDQITVTVTTNVGLATFGLGVIDNATGTVQSETDPIFSPARPSSQTPPTGTSTVQWTLTAVRPGTVIFSSGVHGEVRVCQNGQLFWAFGTASGQSGTVTVNGASITPTPTAAAGQPDLLFPSNPSWVWDPNAYDNVNQCYHYTPGLVWNVQVKNNGSADAGSFVVNQNYDRQQTVPGLPAGQTSTLYFPFPGRPVATAAPGQPTLSASQSNFLADYTNLVSESNEANNTGSSFVPVFTPTLAGGPTKVFCKTKTPTIGTPVATFTPTPTPTRTRTATRTNTPLPVTITRTPTRTNTPALNPTITRTKTPTLCPLVRGVVRLGSSTGPGIAGVQITATYLGEPYTSVTTDASGQYFLSGCGVQGIVLTPQLAGYSFTPAQQTFMMPGGSSLDFVGTSGVSVTNTPTPPAGACSPVTSVITSVPFTQGGVGDFCWQAADLGSFINNWNMTSLTVNGANFTNNWVPSSSFPAKINGFWYVRYLSTNNFSWFEARP